MVPDAAVDYEELEAIGGAYGCAVGLVSMVLFYCIRVALGTYGIPRVVEEREQWKWSNIAVSLVHSSLVSVWIAAR